MVVEITLEKGVDLSDYVLLEGFPGIGLVGTIAAGYIIEKRKMEPVGVLASDKFPPITTIHKGKPYFPARIYKDPQEKVCVLLAEFVVPGSIVYELSDSILRFARENKLKQIVSLAGMTAPTAAETKQIYGIASTEKIAKFIESKKVKLIQEGVTTGVSGVLMARCAAENFPAMSLLVQTKRGYPDPRASATLIEKLNSLINLKIDTKALIAEAGKIEEKMRRLLDQLSKAKITYKRAEETYPPMYG